MRTKNYALRFPQFFILLLILTSTLRAQVVGWSHPASNPPYGVFSYGVAATSYTELGRSVCTDVAGNVYVYGLFGTGADFDPGAGTTTLTANNTSSNAADMFVAKYNSAGALQWVVRGGVANSTDNNGGNLGSICTDGTNVYVVGALNINATNSGDFAPAAGGCSCAYSSAGTLSLGFVAKLSASSGQWQWVQPWGATTAQNQGQGVCLDPTGNVYVVGQCNGTITLGPSSFVCSDAEAFFGKINSSGVWQWATHGGGAGGDGAGTSGGSISYNVNLGRVTATGAYNSTGVTFGSFPLPNTAGVTDIYLAELNPANGAFLNAIGFGGAIVDEAASCYDPATHDVFLAGQISSSITLPGTGTLNFPGGGTDIFVARYTPNATPTSGTFTWAKSYGLGGTDRAWGIASDGIGSILVCGTFSGSGTINFGATAATQVTSSGTFNEMFVASVLASNGTGLWAIQGADNGSSGTVNDQIRGICARQDGTGISYAVGQLGVGSVAFTPSSLGNGITRSSAGGTDVFIGKVYGGLPLTATQSQVNLTCSGVCTGSATVVASGGFAPYTYSWSPSGGSNATATSLCATNYTVTITDAVNASITKTFNLTQPPAITSSVVSQSNISCNGGSNGAATITASGGTGTLTYNWTPGNPTGDGTVSVSSLGVNTWSCTITDANTCTRTQTVSITQPPALNVSPGSQTNVSCFGGSNATASVTASGGSGTLIYNWTPGNPAGDGTNSVTGLSQGTWTCTVTDANLCSNTATFNITQPSSAVTVTPVSQTNISCNGGSNGAASVTASGGTGTLVYNWMPGNPTGDGTNSVTGLIQGTYTCTVTDVNLCSNTATFNITQPSPIIVTPVSQTNISCNGGSNGAASVTASGGTGTLVYNWTPGNPTGDGTNSVTGLSQGTWTCTVTDANLCSNTATFNITQPTAIVVTPVSQTNISCNGGSNGAASVTASGGTGTLTYNWTPGNPTGDGTNSVTGLSQGTWTCTVTDANLCSNTATFNITQPTAIVVTPVSQTNISCNGGSNGAASVTASGGTGTLTYNWTPGNPTGDGTNSVTGLSQGTWTCTVTDANLCSNTATFNITQPSPIVVTPVSQTNISCNGGSNGAASVTASGGTGTLTYNWTPGNPTGDGTNSVTGLSQGTWTCTVTDANLCSNTATFNITQPSAIVVTPVSQTNISCNGGSNGAASVTASGGTGTLTYNWTPGNPTGDGTNSVTGLSQGTWTCTVTDANLCSSTATFNITQPSAISSSVTSQTNVTCNGQSNGAATVSASGGSGGFLYSWTPSGGNAATASSLAAGNYTCTITDANGCSVTETVNITEPSPVAAALSGQTNVSCNGGSTGTATVVYLDGVGAPTYSWAPSGGNAATGTGLSAGSYTCTISDQNGCSTTVTVNITEPPAINASLTSQTNVNCNGNTNGEATIAASGGEGTITYSWAPAGGNAPTASGLSSGTYTCIIADDNLCTVSVTVAITEPPAIVASVSAFTNVTCNGNSDGTATVTASGGFGTLTYDWQPGSMTTATVTGLAGGTYTCTVNDDNGCFVTLTVTITDPASITSSVIAQSDVSCSGDSNGSATLSASGGTGTLFYSWSPTGGNAASASNLSAFDYTVTITDENGCFTTQIVSILEPGLLSASISAQTDLTCFGGSNGSATTDVSGGTPGYTYSWAPSGGNGVTATGLSAGAYTCTITDARGCETTVTTTITEPGQISVSIAAQTDASCNGNANGSATVAASGGTGVLTYAWTPTGGNSATATGLSAGSYTCTVTDNNGCTVTQPVTITEPDAIAFTLLSQTDVSCNTGANGSVSISVSGGTGSYTYNWTPGNPTGDGTASISGLTAGTYTCTTTDGNSCIATFTVIITEPDAITVTPVSTNVSCNGGSNGTADVSSVSGGTPGYTYDWMPSGGNGITATNLAAGSYTCTITDANTCTFNQTFIITEPPVLSVILSKTDETCTLNDGTATATPSGGTSPYSYTWSPGGQTTQTATALSAATYTCMITDNNGCTISDNIAVDLNCNPAPVADFIAVPTTLCAGGTVSFTDNSSNTPTSWSWVFAGGSPSTSTSQNPVIIYNTPGTYSVTLTATNGFGNDVHSEIGYITVNAIPTAGGSVTNVSCFGGNNGAIDLTPSGNGPFTYAWTPSGQTTQDRTGLSNGSYSVTVTDANGCTTQTSFSVVQPTALAVVMSKLDATCANNDGTATATPSGGTGPYTYLWSPGGQTTATATALSAGTYTCVVTDANGCNITGTVTLLQGSCGPTQLANCGITLSALNQVINCVAVPGATNYQYKFMQGTTVIAVYTRGNYLTNCVLSNIPQIQYAQTYTVYVRSFVGNAWGLYGPGCNITTPVFPLTQLVAADCGSTQTNMGTPLNCVAVIGADNYQWQIDQLSGPLYTYTRGNYLTDCNLSTVPGILYGHTYTIKVRTSVGGAWSAFGPSCNVTTPLFPMPQLSPANCGSTMTNLGTPVNCVVVPSATNYQWRFTQGTTVIANFTRGNSLTDCNLSTIPAIQYGQTYEVIVRAYAGGSWGAYGPVCTLTTPAFPTTQVASPNCGATLASLSTQINCVAVPGATNYQWKVQSGAYVSVMNRGNSATDWRLSYHTGTTVNTTYNVSVRAYVAGVWGSYGTVCTVTTGPVTLAPHEDPYVIPSEVRIADPETMAENPELISMNVYPNPFAENMTVVTDASVKNLFIYNSFGELVRTIEIENGTAELKLGDLASGMYLIQAVSPTGNVTRTIIKQ